MLLPHEAARSHGADVACVYLVAVDAGVRDRGQARLDRKVAVALLPMLPEGSHACAYDCYSSHKNTDSLFVGGALKD